MGQNYSILKKLREGFESELCETYSVLEKQKERFELEWGQNYSILEELTEGFEREKLGRETGENFSVWMKERERFSREMVEIYFVLEKLIQIFKRVKFEGEIGENYSVLEKLREIFEREKFDSVLEKPREIFEREMGETYSVLEKLRERFKREMFEEEEEREMDENYVVLEKLRERFERKMFEREMFEREREMFEREMGELEKPRERFEREMGENYSVLEKLNHLMISKACNLTADQIDHIDSFYHRLRFLATILKDMDEKQRQHELNHEAENLSIQIYYVICKTRQVIRSFDVEVPGQRDSNNNGDSFFDILFGINIMEEIKMIEAKVAQFYGQINQIQLLQDDQSFNHGVHSSMSMENRTMVHEEITVGFDDEASTIRELLAGGKQRLQMISIVGMPGLDSGNWKFLNLEFLRHLETLKLCSDIFHRNPTTLGEVKFPANIKRLTLKGTGIEWEEISVLGMMLPNLELLKLENGAAWGQQWATTDDAFPQLKFLKLKYLNVKQWITCSSHFPSLQHLSLERVMIQLLKDEDCLAMASLPCSESNRNGVFKGAIRENVPIRDWVFDCARNC
ncbi:hypothetical protein LOK49_LG11G00388 [Camellia lanceoleosa]|uniref:Uncharacterized protein n=1 Tax=Camellia lanceoleosa TaxID=1840588 RepID=A0ACC0G314_9ERIC|nr:hypothetical protein LOK49_LG11G00388 [Camellia lanceoleosa]